MVWNACYMHAFVNRSVKYFQSIIYYSNTFIYKIYRLNSVHWTQKFAKKFPRVPPNTNRKKVIVGSFSSFMNYSKKRKSDWLKPSVYLRNFLILFLYSSAEMSILQISIIIICYSLCYNWYVFFQCTFCSVFKWKGLF